MNDPHWEEQAEWWQREFTDGADPEYEEQILPLVERHLAGSRRLLDIGCGEGQASRRLTASGLRGHRARPDPSPDHERDDRRGGGLRPG